MRRLCLLAAACALACQPEALQQPESFDGGTADAGHALPGPGFAAAWRVEDPAELITGPSTGGRVGDWELANARVRFVVEDARPSDGFDPYGCSLAAADRQRDAGVPGESRFGEMWMGLNFRAPGCDTVSVVNDGSDGQPAVLRAVGHDAESPFIASLFAVSATPPPLHATIYREYSLAPDADALELTLTIRNDGDAALDVTAPYVGMAMNRGLRHWITRSGFDFGTSYDSIVNLNTSAPFYAAVGRSISYSVLELHAPFSPILNFAHVLIGQYPQLHVPAGQSTSLRFLVAVGTGDVGSLQAAHRQAMGNASNLAPLEGTVTDGAGAPIAGARVHVTDSTGQQAVEFARSAADGSWSAPVPAGTYRVFAVADDRVAGSPRSITVPSTGLQGVDLVLGAQSSVAAAATDPDGRPLPAKIVLEPTGTLRPSLPPALGEMWDRQPVVIFAADGKATVPVYPGAWHVTFSRGFEYDLGVQDVDAPAGGVAAASATLHRVVDTRGWVSGDFHVHAQYSPDGDDLLPLKVRAFAAEGVEVPVSTEHEFIGDFGPAAKALALSPFMHTIAGTELTTTATGHFNIFPLTPMPGTLNAGGFRWYGRTIPDVIAEARARLTPDGLAPVVQMNHPRSPGMSYLDAVGFDPGSFTAGADAADFMTAWDAMEVWNGAPLASFEGCLGASGCVQPAHPLAFDWFSFLDRGRRVTGTGNSDSHRAETQTVGYPRTYLQVGADDPALVTDAQVSAALRSMRATISGGPFLTIAAPASGTGAADTGSGGLVRPDLANGGVVHLTVTVQAPKWMGPLQTLDVWMGDTSARGASLALTADLGGAPVVDGVRLAATWDLAPARDTWVVATVRGPASLQHALWPVVQAPVPLYAITNPIWIDADGDGAITPLR